MKKKLLLLLFIYSSTSFLYGEPPVIDAPVAVDGPLEVKTVGDEPQVFNRFTDQQVNNLSPEQIAQIQQGKMSSAQQDAVLLQYAGTEGNEDLSLVHKNADGVIIDAFTGDALTGVDHDIQTQMEDKTFTISEQKDFLQGRSSTPPVVDQLISVIPDPVPGEAKVSLSPEQLAQINKIVSTPQDEQDDEAFEALFGETNKTELKIDQTLDGILGTPESLQAEFDQMMGEESGPELKLRLQQEAQLAQEQGDLEDEWDDIFEGTSMGNGTVSVGRSVEDPFADSLLTGQELEDARKRLFEAQTKKSKIKEALDSIQAFIGEKIKSVRKSISNFFDRVSNVVRFDRAITAQVSGQEVVPDTVFSSIADSSTIDPDALQANIEFYNKEINLITSSTPASENLKAHLKQQKSLILSQAETFVHQVDAAQEVKNLVLQSDRSAVTDFGKQQMTASAYLNALGNDPVTLGKMVTGSDGTSPATLEATSQFSGSQDGTDFYAWLKTENSKLYLEVNDSTSNSTPLTAQQVSDMGTAYQDYIKTKVFVTSSGSPLEGGEPFQISIANLPKNEQVAYIKVKAAAGDKVAQQIEAMAQVDATRPVLSAVFEGKSLQPLSDGGQAQIDKLSAQSSVVQGILADPDAVVAAPKLASVDAVDAFAQTLTVPDQRIDYWKDKLQKANAAENTADAQQARSKISAMNNEIQKFNIDVGAVFGVDRLFLLSPAERETIQALGKQQMTSTSYMEDLGSNAAFELGEMLTGSNGSTHARVANTAEFSKPVEGQQKGFFQWLSVTTSVQGGDPILADAIQTSSKKFTPLTKDQVIQVGKKFGEYVKQQIGTGKTFGELPRDVQTAYLRVRAQQGDEIAQVLAPVSATESTHPIMEALFNGQEIAALSGKTDAKIQQLAKDLKIAVGAKGQ